MNSEIKYNKHNKIGVLAPDILMPNKEVDLEKWSVVACDQYTSQPEYWGKVSSFVGDSPSTLNLIFPEVYLEEDNTGERIKNINNSMKKYIDDGIVIAHPSCFILIDRKTSHTESRKGLIMAVDLEEYDYNKGSQTLIRATEGTVIERLPPRIRVRQNASMELPHVMLLIDDPERTVIEPLMQKISGYEKLYDFVLMMDSGYLKGYKIDDPQTVSSIIKALENLADREVFNRKYGVDNEKGVLLFAVGDGNHSLATAKACWENIKKTLKSEDIENHPARYALVELVNVHDDGLVFEPIHRVVFNVNFENVLNGLVDFLCDCNASYRMYETKEQMQKDAGDLSKNKKAHILPFITNKGYGLVVVDNPKCNLEVGTLQAFLDELVKNDSTVKIDYIHGDDVVYSLGSKKGNIGFYLPSMNKNDLFKTVILDGVLPRKTFSMGEADEKRFYLECRKISL
ncbi:MAG: DUF1015 domain-containing protein [Clostridia bacterium]|nr:DUF1015 domain-containing protein [Clostridia bacterium]